MIAKETLKLTMTKSFSLKERFRVLFGYSLMMNGFVEVSAKYIAKSKEVLLTSEMKGTESFFGRIVPQKALPAVATEVKGAEVKEAEAKGAEAK